jgi:GntR family transcriptional repressor for pyruvate dehydrogenase complex
LPVDQIPGVTHSGVFVTDQVRAGIASPWGQLAADHPALRSDIVEFRRVLEGATA